MTNIAFWIDSGMSAERKRASLARFIDDVMPAFRDEASRPQAMTTMTDRHTTSFSSTAWTEGGRRPDDGKRSENPATGEPWATFACAAPGGRRPRRRGGRRALDDPAWRDMTQTARGKLLYRLAELIEENADALGRVETTDSGKLLAETVDPDPLCRRLLPLLRRARRQDRRRGAADRQAGHARLHHARADRRRRRRRAVERADVPDRDQARPGAGGWVHGGAESLGALAPAPMLELARF